MGRTVKYDHKGREVFNSSWPADMNEDSVEPLCSGGLTNEAFTKFYQHVKDPNNGWIDLGAAKAKSQQEPQTEDKL